MSAHMDAATRNDLEMLRAGFSMRELAELWMGHALALANESGLDMNEARAAFDRLSRECERRSRAEAQS